MANWYGAARTNYVRIADMEGLEKALAPFSGIEMISDERGVAFLPDGTDDGDFPSYGYAGDDEMTEVEFSFEETIMPFVEEGEVLVSMRSGAEKLRYITGHASAYVRQGDEIKRVEVSVYDIYEKAEAELGVKPRTLCEY